MRRQQASALFPFLVLLLLTLLLLLLQLLWCWTLISIARLEDLLE